MVKKQTPEEALAEVDLDDPALWFQGEELEERVGAGFRAMLGIPSANEREAQIRRDIYRRNGGK